MRAACRGFNLIEFVVLVVVVSIAATGLLTLFTQSAKTLGTNEDVQTAAQLAQQCSEHILAFRRDSDVLSKGYDNIPLGTNISGSASCSSLPLVAGYTRTVDVTDLTSSPPCTSVTPGSCKRVVVKVLRGAVNRASVTFMLVKT